METSDRMQKVIEALAEKHGLDLEADEAHLRLDNPPFEPLVIEKVGRHLVSVAHYYEQGGDQIADPDVVFFTGYGQWVATEIQHPPPFGWMQYVKLSDDGEQVTHLKARGQADLASFVAAWARNLENQGWLDV